MANITCPRCGSQVPLRRFLSPASKPFCTRCGWNVEHAEAALDTKSSIVKLIPLVIAGAVLFAAVTASRTEPPFVFIIPALFALLALAPVWNYHSTRKALATAKLTANASLAMAQPPLDPSMQMLQTLPRPRRVRFRFRGSVAVIAIVLVAVLGCVAFFLAGAQVHRGDFPQNRGLSPLLLPFIFVLVGFAIFIVVPILRERRNLPLLRDGELAFGRVTSQQTVQQGRTSYSRIDYEFQSNTGQLVRNSSRDLTNAIFEDMTIPIFYDPLDPSKNIASCATYLRVVNSLS